MAHAKGAWFHTDAVQAAGKVPFDVEALDVDFASMTRAQDLRAEGRRRVVCAQPQGTAAGACDRRADRRRRPRARDAVGHVERAGHRRVRRAAEIARAEMPGEVDAGRGACAIDCSTRLQATTDGMTVNGAMDARLPGNLNVSFAGVDGEALLVSLDDMAVSSGAACTQAEPSHVLKALGSSKDRALASLRFGIGRWTTAAEIDDAVAHVGDVVARLRQMSPA